MSSPLVSVITPCFNGGRFIRKALDSLKASTYQNLEHIIIDDCSTDDSLQLLETLKSEYNFTLITSEVNQGPAKARNQAIAHSSGKYLLPLDCDNYLSNDFIETLTNAAESLGEDSSPFYTKIIWFGELNREFKVPDGSIQRLIEGPCMDMSSLVLRKAFDLVGGFDPICTPLEDYELFLSMALLGFQAKFVDGPSLFYNLRADSESNHFSDRATLKKQEIVQYIFHKHSSKLRQLGWDPNLAAAKLVEKFAKNPLKKLLEQASKKTPETPRNSERQQASENTSDSLKVNSTLLQLVPADAKVVVEVGCGTGANGEQYKRINPHSQYIGIEAHPEQAKIAARRLDRVITRDVEHLDDATLAIPEGTVDCIVYNDILPQQKDPSNLLKHHTALLSEDAQVLARIPNVQHWHQIVNLLRGKWELRSSGAQELRSSGAQEQGNSVGLDPGQLRFFTLDSIKQLFADAGLQIYEIQTVGRQTEEFQKFLQLMAPAIEALGIEPATFATQTVALEYIVRATKSQVPPRRLLIQTNMMGSEPCYRVRILEPDALCRTIPGVRTVATVKSAPLNVALPVEEKVFIWQRSILRYPVDIPKIKQLLGRGYLIDAETDDDPLWRPEYAEGQFFNFRGCHCVQTTTEALANFIREHNPNVAVFANQLAFLPPPRSYSAGNKVTLFFGAFRRESDWAPIMRSLNKILAFYKDRVWVKVIYDRQFFDALETEQKEFESLCSYQRYQEILRSCDIGLLPLNPTRFNSMKSDLKFLECAGHGVAVLASPTVYDQSIVEGETGLIYRSVEEFEAKLHELIANTQLRLRLAANAYRWVAENRLLSLHYRQRRDWYLQMRDELPRLNEELRCRVPELFVD